MTIHIPRGVAIAAGVVAALFGVYLIREEGPPLYRYLFKFEAM
jgi:hypothetical protein